jgi:transposase-like protein
VPVDLHAELKRLRRENAVLKQERDIPKKAAVGSIGQRDIFGLRCSERTHDGTHRSPWLVTRTEG